MVCGGCRPQYMPVLVALIEAMADHNYGVEHSGNTPGGETLIILNGPIIKQLGFNWTQGALRDGFMPNTTIGRFWRLYLRGPQLDISMPPLTCRSGRVMKAGRYAAVTGSGTV